MELFSLALWPYKILLFSVYVEYHERERIFQDARVWRSFTREKFEVYEWLVNRRGPVTLSRTETQVNYSQHPLTFSHHPTLSLLYLLKPSHRVDKVVHTNWIRTRKVSPLTHCSFQTRCHWQPSLWWWNACLLDFQKGGSWSLSQSLHIVGKYPHFPYMHIELCNDHHFDIKWMTIFLKTLICYRSLFKIHLHYEFQ